MAEERGGEDADAGMLRAAEADGVFIAKIDPESGRWRPWDEKKKQFSPWAQVPETPAVKGGEPGPAPIKMTPLFPTPNKGRGSILKRIASRGRKK